MKPRAIRLGGNALLVTLSTILSLILLEFLVRAFFPIYDPSGHVKFIQLADGTLLGPRGAVLRQTKNTGDFNVEVRFNDWGLRDKKPLTAAKEDDLFVVGDSFAFGWGVNSRDRFSNRLQTILNRPVFNISIGGGDFDGYHRLIRYAEANGAAVRNLVVSVTMENDLHIYDSFGSWNSTPSSTRTVLPSLNLSRIKAHLTGNLALYAMLTHAVHQTKWLRNTAVQLNLIRPNLDGIGDENVSREALSSSASRLVQLVAGRNAVIVIIPSRRLWVGEMARRVQAAGVHTAFIDKLRTYGMNVVDMRDRLEIGGNPLSYHFVNDGHWNEAGHRLAAEALSEGLTTEMETRGTLGARRYGLDAGDVR
jgi:SGNH hydrolase-like domain, acetyltransferase AlgX